MNETTERPDTAPPPDPDAAGQGPQQGHQFNRSRLENIDELRRSATDRHIAGVAGGLGQHFNVDPIVIRVALAVLTFFGGAGLVIYGAVWLLVPEEGARQAPIDLRREPRRILLYTAFGVAFLLAIGDSFNGFGLGWPLASIAVVIAIVLAVRDRRSDRASAPLASSYDTATTTGLVDERAAISTDTTPLPADFVPEGAGEGVAPPTRKPLLPPYTPPRRPRRTGIVWFWPTLALIAIGLGILGIYDVDHRVADGAYPALALAITGVILLVGSVRGRPGGLILVGLISSLALTATVVVGGAFGTDAGQFKETPLNASAVQGDYHATVGEIVLDLRKVSDPEHLAGRTVDLGLRTGHVHVIVPRSLNVQVHAGIDFAGGITLGKEDSGGINHSADQYLPGTPATAAAPLTLDITAKFGQITVEQK